MPLSPGSRRRGRLARRRRSSVPGGGRTGRACGGYVEHVLFHRLPGWLAAVVLDLKNTIPPILCRRDVTHISELMTKMPGNTRSRTVLLCGATCGHRKISVLTTPPALCSAAMDPRKEAQPGWSSTSMGGAGPAVRKVLRPVADRGTQVAIHGCCSRLPAVGSPLVVIRQPFGVG